MLRRTLATLKIINRTKYRSDHLRAFATKARDQVFGDDRKRLEVEFRCGRRGTHRGRASIRGSWSVIWLPPDEPDRYVVAQLLVHEFAHNAGAKGERWMRRGTKFGWGPGWRENVAWAETLPLDLAPPQAKPAEPDRIGSVLAGISEREKAWRTKAKRAATALKKLARRRGYYERKLAATKAGSA